MNFRKHLPYAPIWIALFLFFPTWASSQTSATEFSQYIEESRKAWDIPGLAVAIVKDGKVVLAEGFGQLENDKKEKVDENTLFAIASNTKAFIATAICMLQEEGKLSLDDPVKKHLPYFELYDPWVTEKVTIRDLLCHRVGLGTFSGDVIWFQSNKNSEEIVRLIKHVPQDFGFRNGYGYSNLMFITAGEVIKSVSGKSWDAYLRDKIFIPLDMQRTRTSITQLDQIDNVATPHKPIEGKNQPIEWANWDAPGAAGGILSSVSDLAKWMNLQLNSGKLGEKEIFSTDSQDEFWHPHNNNRVSRYAASQYPGRHFSGYGLGWGLSDYRGKKVCAHGGGYDGMYSRLTLVPEENLGVVVLTNSMKGISTWMTYHILDQYLKATDEKGRNWREYGLERQKRGDDFRAMRVQKRIDKRVPNTKASLDLVQYAGTYSAPIYGEIQVEEKDGQLRLIFPTAPALNASLSHWHYDSFRIEWDKTPAWFDFGTIQFQLDNNGGVQGAQFDVPNDDIFFEEVKLSKKP
ncbi:MAG: serine hydrolase [Bacteroidota bacterium]